jgi:putative flippase GtrA
VPVNLITSFIDFFHPPFKKWMPLQTFRYAACGGGNTVLGFLIYTLGFTVIFNGKVFDFGVYALKPHVASLLLAFIINFPVGFFLMKYVVFVDSNLKGRVQLFRYFFVFLSNLVLNYFILKLMVEYLQWNAIFSQVLATAIVILTSYILQRYFTFKTVEE